MSNKEVGGIEKSEDKREDNREGISRFGILLCEMLRKDLPRPTPVMQE